MTIFPHSPQSSEDSSNSVQPLASTQTHLYNFLGYNIELFAVASNIYIRYSPRDLQRVSVLMRSILPYFLFMGSDLWKFMQIPHFS